MPVIGARRACLSSAPPARPGAFASCAPVSPPCSQGPGRGPLLDSSAPHHTPHRTPDFVEASIPPAAPTIAPLKLGAALQLLRQSGRELPERGSVGDAPWLQAVIDALCEISSRDPLTGLANRRQFELALASEIDRVARAGESALVLMIDIDFFKKVNDTHGHLAGEHIVQRDRGLQVQHPVEVGQAEVGVEHQHLAAAPRQSEIGRASCRERV